MRKIHAHSRPMLLTASEVHSRKQRDRLLAMAMLLILAMLLCAVCGIFTQMHTVEGLENYSLHLCSLGLTANLFPSEDFLTRFPYTEGSFDYQDAVGLATSPDWGSVRTISVLTYAPEDYAQAKAFCMEQFVLSQARQLTYGGFSFVENNTYGTQHASVDWGMPKHFNLFGWQDESCELMFLGYYSSREGTAKDMLPEDFGGFMNAVFGGYYDFQPDDASRERATNGRPYGTLNNTEP